MTTHPPEDAPVPSALDLLLHYTLPDALIAQQPLEPRDASRLLVVDRQAGSLMDRHFSDLPDLLRPGDLLVLNDTRVFNARLKMRRSSGGAIEALLLREERGPVWRALVRPARRLRDGERLCVLSADGTDSGERVVFRGRYDEEALLEHEDFPELAARYGQVPLPPYIHADLADSERYQTVVAHKEGSAAAPTAGLHFTEHLIASIQERNVRVRFITLHVGLGTFQPIKASNPFEHRIHQEYFHVLAATLAALRESREAGRRVVAVGTTVARTLETIAPDLDTQTTELSGWSGLFIHPPYRYRLVDALVTNFHLPQTSLLLLVAALAGSELTLRAYQHAIEQRYRFYSFGDAMFIV